MKPRTENGTTKFGAKFQITQQSSDLFSIFSGLTGAWYNSQINVKDGWSMSKETTLFSIPLYGTCGYQSIHRQDFAWRKTFLTIRQTLCDSVPLQILGSSLPVLAPLVSQTLGPMGIASFPIVSHGARNKEEPVLAITITQFDRTDE